MFATSTFPAFADRRFDALLFDMDGTLLTSIEASQRVWCRWAAGFGLDAMTFLPQAHGMRVVEVIAHLGLPGIDAAAEAEKILQAELVDMDGVREVAGASAFLASLPPTRWAIVTSAPRALAERRLAAAHLPTPAVLVAAEDIERGKPDPSCYRLAAVRLGVDVRDCLVFEDAPAGIAAGEAAGSSLLVVTAAHASPLRTTHPSVPNYGGLAIERDPRRQTLRVLSRTVSGLA